MYVVFTPQIVPLLVSALIGLVLASYGWRNRPAAGAGAFTLMQLSLVEMAIVEALVLTVVDPANKVSVTPWDYIGATVAPTAWLIFVLQYTGVVRHGSWRLIALLTVEPLIALALAATNASHGLIWQSITYTGGVGDGIVGVDGAVNGFAMVYDYSLGAIGATILGWKLYASRRLGWHQVGGLAIATLITVIFQSGVLDSFTGGGVDLVPYGMCGSGVALYWGFLHYRLLELGTIAHHAAFDSMSDGIVVVDIFGNVAEINPIATAIVGLPRTSTLGRPLASLVSSSAFAPLREMLRLDVGSVEVALDTERDGQHYEVQIQALRHRRQRLPARLVTFRNVTARRLADAALRQSEERFRLQYRDSPIATYTWRRIGHEFIVEDVNAAAQEFAASRNSGSQPRATPGDDMRQTVPGFCQELERCWSERTRSRREMSLNIPGGPSLDLVLTFAFVPPDRVMVHAEDVTARRQAHLELEHQAVHDALTGLPNRILLRSRLSAVISRALSSHASAALLMLDLDRFKDVNDTLGHAAGDALLREVGVRIEGSVRAGAGLDLVARLGGDEFAVLLEGTDQEGALRVAESILSALRLPVEVDGHLIAADASIGIAMFPDHAGSAEELLRHADVAMYVAKGARLGASVYSAENDRHDPRRLEFIGELRTAIEQDELFLEFQPQIELSTGDMLGVEALVRWQHPGRGRVNPDEFISVAEQTGLIRPLSQWVLNAALQAAHRWHASGLDVAVSVNLSTWDLHDPDLVTRISRLLQEHGVHAAQLRVEVTESSLMVDADRACGVLSDLRQMGVRSSVDDFGTGYSSLARLKRLPVDELKIDRAFVRDMANNDDDRAIVQSTIDLAHNLGLRVVAEGVEDQLTVSTLADLSCDFVQGYFFARPMPAAQLGPWLMRRSSAAAELRAAA